MDPRNRHRHHLSAKPLDRRAGNSWAGCYEAVVIARSAGFRMLAASVMRRLSPYSITVRSRAKQSCQNVPKNRCRTTKAERMGETLAELLFTEGQIVCLGRDQAAEKG